MREREIVRENNHKSEKEINRERKSEIERQSIEKIANISSAKHLANVFLML